MTQPVPGDAATLAARRSLVRTYQRVFTFMHQRALAGDVVARGFERELGHTFLPLPSRADVRRWLSGVGAVPRVFNPATDPWIGRQLMNEMRAVEARSPLLTEQVWVEVATAVRAATLR